MGHAHMKNHHGGKRVTMVFCKPVNCKLCRYRKFLTIIITITSTITTNTTL